MLSLLVVPLQQGASGSAATSLQVAAEVSTVVMTVIAVVLLVAILLVSLQLKKLLGSIQQHIQPVTERARVAAENVEYITGMVRQDVQKVRASVSGLSDRLGEASKRMEERVEEFNALMDVVQDEAESVLLDTAAIVRGVRAGAQTVGESVAREVPGGDPQEPTPLEGSEDSDVDEKDPEVDGEDSEADDEVEDAVGEAMAKEAPESE